MSEYQDTKIDLINITNTAILQNQATNIIEQSTQMIKCFDDILEKYKNIKKTILYRLSKNKDLIFDCIFDAAKRGKSQTNHDIFVGDLDLLFDNVFLGPENYLINLLNCGCIIFKFGHIYKCRVERSTLKAIIEKIFQEYSKTTECAEVNFYTRDDIFGYDRFGNFEFYENDNYKISDINYIKYKNVINNKIYRERFDCITLLKIDDSFNKEVLNIFESKYKNINVNINRVLLKNRYQKNNEIEFNFIW